MSERKITAIFGDQEVTGFDAVVINTKNNHQIDFGIVRVTGIKLELPSDSEEYVIVSFSDRYGRECCEIKISLEAYFEQRDKLELNSETELVIKRKGES